MSRPEGGGGGPEAKVGVGGAPMTACEKCWVEATARHEAGEGGSVTDVYHRLIDADWCASNNERQRAREQAIARRIGGTSETRLRELAESMVAFGTSHGYGDLVEYGHKALAILDEPDPHPSR